MTAVVAERVTVHLDGRAILRDVSVSVDRGDWLAIIGPNGAGKSTLLRALAGLLPCDGSITIRESAVRAMRPRERAQLVALVPQTPIIPPAIAVTDYVMLGRTPHIGVLGVESRHDRAAVAEVMQLLGLLPFATRRVETLSGGERQRVFLARALAQQAPVLLLDEPTSALDIGHQQDVLELVDSLRVARDLTVVMTMHDLTLAGRYADRLALLANGEIVTAGSSDDVLTEEHLARHYGASVRILRDEHGLVVVPHRVPRESRTMSTEADVPKTPPIDERDEADQ